MHKQTNKHSHDRLAITVADAWLVLMFGGCLLMFVGGVGGAVGAVAAIDAVDAVDAV